MSLTSELCSDPRIDHAWSDEAALRAMLAFEAALARACARHGVVPARAADIIARCCDDAVIDLPRLRADSSLAGNCAQPLVLQLTAAVHAVDPGAAGYVHWGATSQDVLDTGMVLQLKRSLTPMTDMLDALMATLAERARQERATVMAGRTLLQQAVPITLGMKLAQWLDALTRHRRRLDELGGRVLALQFGGAAGTLASLGSEAGNIRATLAEALALEPAAIAWHTTRDRVLEIGSWMGMLIVTLAKMARDVSLLAQTEVAELTESNAPGKGVSSTMPHKRNPVHCAAMLAAGLRAPGLVATLYGGAIQEHERALGGWQAEWNTLPDLVRLAGGVLRHGLALASGLQVQADGLQRNLDLGQGMMLAEAVALALGRHIGKAAAHARVEVAAAQAREQGEPLWRALSRDPAVTAHLGADALRALTEPAAYLGRASLDADAVVAWYWREAAARMATGERI